MNKKLVKIDPMTISKEDVIAVAVSEYEESLESRLVAINKKYEEIVTIQDKIKEGLEISFAETVRVELHNLTVTLDSKVQFKEEREEMHFHQNFRYHGKMPVKFTFTPSSIRISLHNKELGISVEKYVSLCLTKVLLSNINAYNSLIQEWKDLAVEQVEIENNLKKIKSFERKIRATLSTKALEQIPEGKDLLEQLRKVVTSQIKLIS